MAGKTEREIDNPYLAARQEWNERYGSYIRAAHQWRIIAFVSLGMAVVGTGYALFQSTQVKLIPYIVEVDKLGSASLAEFPERIEYADERVLRAMLGSWISNFRSVTPDATVQKRYIDKTYAMLNQQDSATKRINAWFQANSPFVRARSETVSIEASNIVALSERTYQIDWTETIRDRDGKELALHRYRGIATVSLSPPQNEAVIRLNPIGLYVKEFDWTEQL